MSSLGWLLLPGLASLLVAAPPSAAVDVAPGFRVDVVVTGVPRPTQLALDARGGLVALSSAVLPGHAVGEPFTDPQHPVEVTNGCPPAFRA